MAMIEYVGNQDEPARPSLQLTRVSCADVLRATDVKEAQCYGGVEVSMLSDDLDTDLAQGLISFCAAVPAGVARLSITHTDLGSGTDCEQRLFELIAERRVRENEKVVSETIKRNSSKEKDFSVAAGKRRQGQAGIDASVERLAAIDAELAEVERMKLQTSWYVLFSHMQAVNFNSIHELDLSNCSLHATGLVFLTQIMLELENRAEGTKISWLALDGNDLTDIGMGVLASFLRLSKSLEVLQVRNVGISEQGVSELAAGLVSNRSLKLLDVRANGLVDLDAARSAISGVQRFNSNVQILLT